MRAVMMVATHRHAEMPSDGFYQPVHVGHATSKAELGYQADDVGENISDLNSTYCELTATYWGWKNLRADAVGLSHYRRYFRGEQSGPSMSRILSRGEAMEILDRADVIVPRRRNYVVETIDSHYRNAHYGADLDILRNVVAETSPRYLNAYDQVFNGRSMSLYNMLFARRDVFDAYCAWLFPILEQVRYEIGDTSARTAHQQRVMGFMGEPLLNVWITGTPDLTAVRRPVLNIHGEPKFSKAVKMTGRKFGVGSRDRLRSS